VLQNYCLSKYIHRKDHLQIVVFDFTSELENRSLKSLLAKWSRLSEGEITAFVPGRPALIYTHIREVYNTVGSRVAFESCARDMLCGLILAAAPRMTPSEYRFCILYCWFHGRTSCISLLSALTIYFKVSWLCAQVRIKAIVRALSKCFAGALCCRRRVRDTRLIILYYTAVCCCRCVVRMKVSAHTEAFVIRGWNPRVKF
jgi:hypothetical protein